MAAASTSDKTSDGSGRYRLFLQVLLILLEEVVDFLQREWQKPDSPIHEALDGEEDDHPALKAIKKALRWFLELLSRNAPGETKSLPKG